MMTCDLCGQREANVHLTEVVNDQTRELHLCERCAREKGAEAAGQMGIPAGGPESFLTGGLAELLAGLSDLGLKGLEEKAGRKVVCPQCGMSFDDFRKVGRLGCGQCYEAFQRFLGPLLRRIHGSAQYVGRAPLTGRREPQPAGRGPRRGQPTAEKAGTPATVVEGQAPDPGPRFRGEGQAPEDVGSLREKLKKAVAEEDFEAAAVLRDRIRALEKGVGSKVQGVGKGKKPNEQK